MCGRMVVCPSEIKLQALKTKVENVLVEDFWISFCNYLPSKTELFLVFYKQVTCEHPPKVKNSVVQSEAILGNQTYLLNSQLIYSCENETETDDNKSIVTCLYSGKWSKPPQCKPKANPKSKSLNPLIVTIPVLGVPFVLITIMYCLFKCKTNRINIPLFRNKIFDAFVSYCYEETGAQFAENTLRIELEENVDPPFKLFIHRRDFQAAWDIMWNINNAIKNSNSAIIIMSQDYVT